MQALIQQPENEKQALMILSALPDIGSVRVRRLLEDFGDALSIFKASTAELSRVRDIGPSSAASIRNWSEHFDLAYHLKRLDKMGAEYVTRSEEKYPELLNHLYDAPTGLYWKGDYQLNDNGVAIVGTRKISRYGEQVTQELATGLVQAGYCIVSGLARGVDAVAHEAAIKAGGKTIGVLGCGLDIVYPPEHRELYKQIAQNGAVVSEFYCGRQADRQTFPIRNRVIAGMCRGVIVVESDLKGGSMITARFAGEQGRHIFAVPGRIDSPTSAGCNALIRDGAILVTSAQDVIDELRYMGQLEMPIMEAKGGEKELQEQISELSQEEQEILKHFELGERLHMDKIVELTQKSIAEISSSVMMLEIKGLVIKNADGTYELSGNLR